VTARSISAKRGTNVRAAAFHSRTSVVADPDVIAAQPLQPLYPIQNQYQTDRWSSPYDLAPVFNEVIAKMIDGSYDAAAAHEAAVKGQGAVTRSVWHGVPGRWYPQGASGTRPLSDDDPLTWYVA
jgi:hypothetical protein